jgi:dihydroorotate dehydrogenase electron transfer subunit
MVRCPGVYLRRPLYIHRCQKEHVSFLFHPRPEDPCSSWLTRLHPGDTVDILGPLGRGFDLREDSRNILLAWAGGEVAPLLALAHRVDESGRSISFLGESEALQVPAGLLPVQAEYHFLQEGAPLAPFLRWADQVFASGSSEFYARLRRDLLELEPRIRQGRAQVLANAPVVCGMGVCGGCAVDTRRGPRRKCHDGPFFDLRDLKP